MGLSEKARHTLARDLLHLLDREGPPSAEAVRDLTLALDAYRRELRGYVARHQNQARLIADEVDRAEREVARWEQRLFLAERRASELLEPVQERLGAVRGKRDGLRREQAVLARAIANLQVAQERVEQALRYVRRQVPSLEQAEGDLREAQAIRDLKEVLLTPDEVEQVDELEEAFAALELEELAGDLQAPRPTARGGASRQT